MAKNFKLRMLSLRAKWGSVILLGLVIIVLFLLLRLPNLTILPVFVDEAIYIRWSQVMRTEPTLRFLPLSDGKQPLFMWLTIPFLKLFSDPLFAGRLLSVLCGLGSLIGLFFLSLELYKDKRMALVTSFLYAVIPFFVFFDRMALVDSSLMMFGIWTVFFGILLARLLRLDLAMITGIILGAALITKSPAIFFALWLPLTLLLANWLNLENKPQTAFKLLKLVGLWFVVGLFSLVIYNLLRLGPNFQLIAMRNKDYVYSLREVISHPLDPLLPHLGDLKKWLPNLFTWPIFLVSLLGLGGMSIKKSRRETIFLFILVAFSLLVQSSMAKVFTSRYLLFAIWPLVIFAAGGLELLFQALNLNLNWSFKKLGGVTLLLAVVTVPSLCYDYRLLSQPETAPLPREMRNGYLEEWTAGQGLKEVAAFLKEKAKEGNVLVGTEGYFGTLPDGLQIYLEGTGRITVIGVGYPIRSIHPSLINSLTDNRVFLVVNQSRLEISPEANGLKLVNEYPKAIGPDGKQDKLLFFEVDKNLRQTGKK